MTQHIILENFDQHNDGKTTYNLFYMYGKMLFRFRCRVGKQCHRKRPHLRQTLRRSFWLHTVIIMKLSKFCWIVAVRWASLMMPGKYIEYISHLQFILLIFGSPEMQLQMQIQIHHNNYVCAHVQITMTNRIKSKNCVFHSDKKDAFFMS